MFAVLGDLGVHVPFPSPLFVKMGELEVPRLYGASHVGTMYLSTVNQRLLRIAVMAAVLVSSRCV